MSASPGVMQAMLAQSLMQGQQPSSYGGGSAGPQMQAQVSPLNAASQAVQQAMLMRALQQRPQQPGQSPIQPQPNMLGGVNAIPQQMNQQPIPGGSNA